VVGLVNVIGAVVFDLDGVIVDSEHLWDRARRTVVADHGGRWRDDATGAMQGMSSPEWGQFVRDALAVDLPTERIIDLVVQELLDGYERHLPVLPGAVEAVRRLAVRWPLGLASSSNRVVIDTVLRVASLSDAFAVTVSSEEVARGKPAPDVYLEVVGRLDRHPPECAAVEDSTNGIRSALAAGLHVVVVPNAAYPPSADALAAAPVVLDGLHELTVELVEGLGS
jgi:HAD superfamily hydrolase (TIGR01509 family)